MNCIIELTQHRKHKDEVIHPTLLIHNDVFTLVDCGDPGLIDELLEDIRKKGVKSPQIHNLLLTHHDLDHMGGASQLRDRYPSICVMASGEQAEYICGRRRWLRLQEEDWKYLALPPEKRTSEKRSRVIEYTDFLPCRVDTILRDGQSVPLCGKCIAISTPWHMQGHLSFFLPEHKAFLAGDAFSTFEGKLDFLSHVNLNQGLASDGLRRLLRLDVEVVYGYHGGVLRFAPTEFRTRLEQLARNLDR